MNPDTELDLAPEELDDIVENSTGTPAPQVTPEEEEKDIIAEGEEIARNIIGQNIFDVDLEKSLNIIIDEHFKELPRNSLSNYDIFHIPDLNQKIWQTFRNYEDFVHQNKFENIDLNEIAAIIREKVTPDITKKLCDLIVQ